MVLTGYGSREATKPRLTDAVLKYENPSKQEKTRFSDSGKKGPKQQISYTKWLSYNEHGRNFRL